MIKFIASWFCINCDIQLSWDQVYRDCRGCCPNCGNISEDDTIENYKQAIEIAEEPP